MKQIAKPGATNQIDSDYREKYIQQNKKRERGEKIEKEKGKRSRGRLK